MTYRPLDWAPLAESDPIPGDPDELDRLVGQLRTTATAIEQAAADLRTLAGVDGWHSKAGDTFRERAREVAGSIEQAFDRYDITATALSDYSAALRIEQENSTRALTDARTAAEDVRLSEAAMAGRTDVDSPDYLSLQQSVGDGEVAIGEARRTLELAVEARDEAARIAISKIQNVTSDDGLKNGWWGGFIDFVAGVADIAGTVAAACGMAALVCSFIPGIGPALAGLLGAVATWASAVSLVCNVFLFCVGEASWQTVALDVLGLATAGIGRAYSTMARNSYVGGRQAARIAARPVARTRNPGMSERTIDRRVNEWAGGPAGRADARFTRRVPDAIPPGPWSPMTATRIAGAGFAEDARTIARAVTRQGGTASDTVPTSVTGRLFGDADTAFERTAYESITPEFAALDDVARMGPQAEFQMRVSRTAWAAGFYQDQGVLELVDLPTLPTPNEIPGMRDLPGMPSEPPSVVGPPL